jgi:hypothetical protein
MPFLQAILALVLAPFGVAEGADIAMASKSAKQLSCEIRSTDIRGGVRLEAVVVGRGGASGEYEFVVAKSGSGGTSNVSQGGDFEIGAGKEAVVGEVTLGSAEKAKVKARLTVSSASGKNACEYSYPHRS